MGKPAELPRHRRFTVAEYHGMAEAGLIAPDDRVELLFGVIHTVSPESRAHVIAANLAFGVLRDRLAGRAGVYKEDPLQIASLDSEPEPEPDVMVCSNVDVHDFRTSRMDPLLVVEVAESSLRRDAGGKAALYAKARVPEYWIVNLVDGVLDVLREPEPDGYRTRLALARNAKVVPQAWPDVEIEVGSLFPRDPKG